MLLVLGLAACGGGSEPEPSPDVSASASAEPEVEPIFASDEEALSAAVSAVKSYAVVSDAITNEGGTGSDRIREVVTEEYAAELIAEFDAFAKEGVRTEGSSSIDTTSLVSNDDSGSTAIVSIYACIDVSNSTLIGPGGADVTPSDRPLRNPVVVQLEAVPNSKVLLVDGIDPWSGDDFC
ncbi:hypothetical protein GE115_08825 [Agromyces sp. CFH 90414]|uniref:Uncharacterized protein n=1 Tax=Agromyces agglutinans TaxID=2662258 RepID=A0A6I2FB66_9MICO|nr:hypothetical protein [Agromyces agglutinans]MRG59970.1 hypothetical protein [Agromyces agglutinans]